MRRRPARRAGPFFSPAAVGVALLPTLFVIRGNDQGARYELRLPTLILGRDAASDIQLHDTEVSRRHAELRLAGRRATLVDLESSNGTFVNGERISLRDLASGDHVQVGSTLLLYTGAVEDADAEVGGHVDIGSVGDGSRIVRTITQEEGSRIFDWGNKDAAASWLARARSNLQIMYRTALAVSHTLDIDQLLNRILQLIFDWVEADRGCIMLVSPETKQLEAKAFRARPGVRTPERITISRTILDYVTEHNEGVLTSNAREDERWNPAASILQLNVREAICVPLQARYEMVGVIYIDTSTPPDRIIQQGSMPNKFTEEHLKLMIAIAHQAALAVEDTRYYSAMVQAERLAAVGQTIATLSHHIKNILQGIRGGSYLIEHGLSHHDEAVIRRGWDIVDRNQGKISTLVMDMLTFSKERDPDLAPADINQAVSEVIELMAGRGRDLDVDLVFTPQADIPTLTFDPDGLHRAVLNLVTNALDAAGECDDRRGRVEVLTRYDAATALLQVIIDDNGIGIAPEDREAIFSLFVSRKGGRGTGLGLPVSAKIVKEHGGRITVDSELGRGSRFMIEMPAVLPTSTTQHSPPQAGETQHGSAG